MCWTCGRREERWLEAASNRDAGWLRGRRGMLLFRSLGVALIGVGAGLLGILDDGLSAKGVDLVRMVAAVPGCLLISIGTALLARGSAFLEIAERRLGGRCERRTPAIRGADRNGSSSAPRVSEPPRDP